MPRPTIPRALVGTIIPTPPFASLSGSITNLSEDGLTFQFSDLKRWTITRDGIELEFYDKQDNLNCVYATKPGGWNRRIKTVVEAEEYGRLGVGMWQLDEIASMDDKKGMENNHPSTAAFLGPIIDAGTIRMSKMGNTKAADDTVLANTNAVSNTFVREGLKVAKVPKKVGTAGYTNLMATSLLHAYTTRVEDVAAIDIVDKVGESLSTRYVENTIKGLEGQLERLKEELDSREDKANEGLRDSRVRDSGGKVFAHAAMPKKAVLGKRKRTDDMEDDIAVKGRRKMVVVGEVVGL